MPWPDPSNGREVRRAVVDVLAEELSMVIRKLVDTRGALTFPEMILAMHIAAESLYKAADQADEAQKAAMKKAGLPS